MRTLGPTLQLRRIALDRSTGRGTMIPFGVDS